LPAVIYSHSSVIILLGCLLGMGHLAAPPWHPKCKRIVF
jgi:hypothetical protein